MAKHVSAHRWLVRMGAKEQGVLECYGRNGEDFLLFNWTRKQIGGGHLFQPIVSADSQDAQPDTASNSAFGEQQVREVR